jgi:dTDP-4-amino-4,6-dideoxygalactose transaminase
MEFMKTKGIQTSIHYPPIHQFKAYSEYREHAGNLSITEDIAKREITLPLYPTMTEDQVKMVADELISSMRIYNQN